MEKIKRLPDAELTVMQLIWAQTPPITAALIQEQAQNKWKMTSILTFLARLTEKGFLSCEKEGRTNYYAPIISEKEYLQSEGVNFIERVCGGSVKNLVASLSAAGALQEEDILELKQFLNKQADR